MESMLANADFAEIEAEWQEKKKKRNKVEWYSLFGGPNDVCHLAKRVGWPEMYDFCYAHWSNDVHAGSAFDALGGVKGQATIRPIRHPEVLQASLQHAVNFSLELARLLLDRYAPERLPELRRKYIDSIFQRVNELSGKKVINAPWCDDGDRLL